MEVTVHNGFPVAPRSRDSVCRAARLDSISLAPQGGAVDLPKILDILSGHDRVHYDVLDAKDWKAAGNVEAYYAYNEKTIFFKASMFDALCRGNTRARFTVAHELGHALLEHVPNFNRLSANRIPKNCHSELQANAYAAAFLMNASEIRAKKLYTPAAVASYFKVSIQTASFRLRELGLSE